MMYKEDKFARSQNREQLFADLSKVCAGLTVLGLIIHLQFTFKWWYFIIYTLIALIFIALALLTEDKKDKSSDKWWNGN